MACDLLDLRCIFVSELIGDPLLTIILATVLYFLVAAKLKWRFDTTMVFLIPAILIMGLSITGFSLVFAVITIIAGLLLAWIFSIITGNR